MTSPTLKVAAVGAGYFAGFHYDSWRRMRDVTLVGSCDLDLDKARATGLPAFDDVDQMLAQTSPDVLDVILPSAGHAAAMRAAISAGVKTIICQKPFCTSLAEARSLVTEADAAGVTIVVHENSRFQPWFRRIKQALDAGAIGQVLQATFRLRPGDGQGAEAYLERQPYFQSMPRFLIHETGVHYIDTFRYLMGPVRAVYADLRRLNPAIAGEDAGHVIFDHSDGVRAVLDGNRHLDHAADNLRRTMGEALIEGTEGTLDVLGSGAVMLRAFGDTEASTLLPESTWDGFGGDCVHHLQRHVVDAIATGAAFENEASDYLCVIEIVEAIYESHESGRRITLVEN